MSQPHALQSHPAIGRAIERDGRITFARYMQLALYHPRWGYYSQREVVGESGDFYTSPELHPLFAAAVAARAHAVWRAMRSPAEFDFVEVGGGSGRFARDFILYVDECFPDLSVALRYRIDDRGANLRKAQLQRLIDAHLDRRVHWTDGAPSGWRPVSVKGMVFANELLDALSVHLVTGIEGQLHELYVRPSHSGLTLEPGPPSTPRLAAYFKSLGIAVPDGVQWEVNLNASRWIQLASRAMSAGGLLMVDYGYEAVDLYKPSRVGGTLLCYTRHTVNSDPLRDPGRQDMTTHVDMTTVRSRMGKHGLAIVENRHQDEALGEEPFNDWRSWTLDATTVWAMRAGHLRSLDGLFNPDGLGRLRWLFGLKGVPEGQAIASSPVPIPTGHDVLKDHLILPDATGMDYIPDIELQWRELWEE